MVIDDRTHYLRQMRNFLGFFALILVLFVLKVASEVTLPIAIALFIFALVNPFMSKLEKLKIPGWICVAITMLLVLVLLLGIFYLCVNMGNAVVSRLPYYVIRVASLDKVLSGYLAQYFDEIPRDFSILASLNVDWYNLLMTAIASFSTKTLSIVSDFMMIMVTLLFVLMEKTTFMPKIRMSVKSGSSGRVGATLGRINKQISKYLLLKAAISLATGFCFYLIALTVGLDFALVWGILAFVLNFIPTIGSIVITVVTIFMAVVQYFPSWGPIVYVAVFTTLSEMILGNIIDPKLQGVQLNISPLVLLISLSVWSYIWGIMGMFLAVPIMSIVQIVCAVIPDLRPVAIMLSTGKSYSREHREKEHEKEDRKTRKKKGKPNEEEVKENRYTDVILPEGENKKEAQEAQEEEDDGNKPE